jgi:divalent metal cation (Fe/Co/Zn/Cd) transporter
MKLIKAIAIVYFAVAIFLAGVGITQGYDAYAELYNMDTTRASSSVNGDVEYHYPVNQQLFALLQRAATSNVVNAGYIVGIGAIIWTLADIAATLRRREMRESQ